MASLKEQVSSFIGKCEELKSCKFIMATTKIKDLLKCIVNCPELYGLFEEVTKDFDYPAVKAQCLRAPSDGVYTDKRVVLPQTVGQRLAFIFCLLVEFDRNSVNFNDFLRAYFPEDGSYFASYQSFCNIIIKGLQDCVIQVFREELQAAEIEENVPDARAAEISSALGVALSQEIQFVTDSAVPKDDKDNGLKILTALVKAIEHGDETQIDGLVCGYNYFVLRFGCVSDGIAELLQLIEAYEKLL